MKNRLSLIVAALALAMVPGANAVPISGFGDPITNAALVGGTVIDFDAGPVGLFGAITLSGVTFTGVGAPLNIGPDFNGSFNTRGVNSLFTGFDLDPDALRIDFTGSVSAFGFNWGAADNHWTMSVYDGSDTLLESFVVPPVFGSNAGEYFGIARPGIAYLTLVDMKDSPCCAAGDYIFIDNFSYSGGEPVPEPSTLALLALGGLGLLPSRRKR